jgi:hypothetical protein
LSKPFAVIIGMILCHDVIIDRILYHYLGNIAHLIKRQSVIYWSFDFRLPRRNNSSRILVVVMSNNMRAQGSGQRNNHSA